MKNIESSILKVQCELNLAYSEVGRTFYQLELVEPQSQEAKEIKQLVEGAED